MGSHEQLLERETLMEPAKFEEGENAFNDGLPIASNPYPWGTLDQVSWARGWKHAETAKRKKFSPQDRDEEDDDIPF